MCPIGGMRVPDGDPDGESREVRRKALGRVDSEVLRGIDEPSLLCTGGPSPLAVLRRWRERAPGLLPELPSVWGG